MSLTLPTFLERSADRMGDAAAVVWRGETLRWAELLEGAQRVAEGLTRRGVEPGDRVLVWADKGPMTLQAVWGILYAGATYVPVDLATPPARLLEIAGRAAVKAIVTRHGHYRWLRERATGWKPPTVITLDTPAVDAPDLGGPVHPWPEVVAEKGASGPRSSPSSLAYILFTSGSSGTPKGVCHSHRSATAFAQWAAQSAGLRADDRVSQHAGLHFDLSTFDLYASAVVGAAVCPIPEAAMFRGAALMKIVTDARITVWYSVPAAIQRMHEVGDRAIADSPLETLIFAGEAFPVGALRGLRAAAPRVRLLNFYGPTETNVCTWYEVGPAEPLERPIPVGTPCDDTQVWVLDREGVPVAPGDTGELAVAGPTLMTGYLDDPTATDQAMITVGGEGRAYRTGDLGHRDAEGRLHLTGRIDDQVKVRGHRIELGEIESLLGQHEEVDGATAWVTEAGEEGARLVAAVELRAGASLDGIADALRAHLAARVPPTLLPDIHVVTRLARGANGKIDRAATRRSLQR